MSHSIIFTGLLSRGNAWLLLTVTFMLFMIDNGGLRFVAVRECKRMHPSKKLREERIPYFRNNWFKKIFLVGLNGVIGKITFVLNFIATSILIAAILITVLYMIFYIEIMSIILIVLCCVCIKLGTIITVPIIFNGLNL